MVMVANLAIHLIGYRSMKLVRTLAMLVIACLAGCGFVPSEKASTLEQKQRENVSQNATSEFAQKVQPLPMTVTRHEKDGSTTIIEQPVPSQTQAAATVAENSDSTAAGAAASTETIPMFVKLIGLAIGIGGLVWIIIWAVKALKTNSPAIAAAVNAVDSAIAAKIDTIRALKGASTDPVRIQALSDAEAHMQEARPGPIVTNV